ncbi:MAG: plasmid mobilization protein [Nakamurella sp.]
MAEPLRQIRQVRRPGSPRGTRHVVKVTAEQEARLVERANEAGWTVSRLLVESALAGGADAATARADLAGEMFRVVRLLGNVANNINQMARSTNATGQVQPGTVHALDAIGRATDRLQSVLSDIDAGRVPR